MPRFLPRPVNVGSTLSGRATMPETAPMVPSSSTWPPPRITSRALSAGAGSGPDVPL